MPQLSDLIPEAQLKKLNATQPVFTKEDVNAKYVLDKINKKLKPSKHEREVRGS